MAMEKVVIQLDANTSQAVDNLEELKKEIELLNQDVVAGNKDTAQSLKGVETAGKKTSFSIRGIGKALKAIGIGFIISALATLKETFQQNQVVADKFAEIGETASLVFNELVGVIVNTYTSVEKAGGNFTALGNVVTNLIKVGLTPLRLTLNGLKIALISTQLAYEKLFGDDEEKVKKLSADLKQAGQDTVDLYKDIGNSAVEIYENFGEAANAFSGIVTGVIDGVSKISVKAANETAKANVQLQKQAEIAAVTQQGLIEKYDLQAEKLRQIRDEERNTIDERITANENLKKTLDEQEAAMLKQVDTQIAAAQAEYDKNKNQENTIKLLEAQQEREAVLAQIAGFRSEQLANDLALNREKLELEQSITDAEAERAINEATFTAEQIENEYLRLQALKDVAEQEKVIEEKRLTEKMNSYKEGTQAFQDAQNELFAFQQENGQKQKQLEKDINKAKQQEITNALGNIAGIVGQNSKFGKAIAVVQALRDTYAGANKALAQGGIFGFVGAASIIAGGLANVKQITSSKDPQAPSFARGAGSAPSISTPTAAPAPPAFNIVGAGAENQLAETIAGQTQKPVKAYVVSQDVTTAQSLERNIVDGASI
jgi:hypothetical protein